MGSWLPWRKLASNPPGLDWPALPWQSRGLYALLLGLADDAGVIRLGKLGLQSLAGALRASWPEIEPHFDALVMTGWAEVQAGAVKLPHFEDSQRAATTAERVAQYRERARNEPVTPQKRSSNEPLLKSNEPVTKSYPDKNRSEEIRSDLVGAKPEQQQPELALVPQQAAESKQHAIRKPGTYTALATALLGELSAARMRVNPKNRIFPPSPAHLRELERCLREGLTVEQLRNVILVWEAMVKAGKQDPEHFDSVTPFRASNVAKYTEKSLEEAAKPRGGVSVAYAGRPAPQEPPKSASNPPGGIDFKALREKVEAQRTPEGDAKIKADLDRILGRTS